MMQISFGRIKQVYTFQVCSPTEESTMKPITVLALGRGRHLLKATTNKYIQTSGTADVSIIASPDVEVTVAAFNKSKIRLQGHCRKVTIKYVSTTAEVDCTELSCNRIQVINANSGCTVTFPPMLLA